jgi:hypothetical protein
LGAVSGRDGRRGSVRPECDVQLAQFKYFPPRHQAFPGEMQRFAPGALWATTEPVISLEIAIESDGSGLDSNDPPAVT